MRGRPTKIKRDPVKGRGVYADGPIRRGALIEVCQILVLDESEVGPTLERYVFHFSDTHYAMALGNGPLYNHSDAPNAWVEMDDDNLLIEIRALKAIKKNEEITIDYAYSAEDRQRFGIV